MSCFDLNVIGHFRRTESELLQISALYCIVVVDQNFYTGLCYCNPHGFKQYKNATN